MTDRLANLDEAVAWLRDVWEPRNVPSVLHRRSLVADRDALGGPEMTAEFMRFISARENDKRSEVIAQPCPSASCRGTRCDRCAGAGKYLARYTTWRYPTWHALTRLHHRPGQRWGPLARADWHPTPVDVILAIVAYEFDASRFRLRYADGGLVPRELAEAFAVSAIRKFHASYQRGEMSVLPWETLTDQQREELLAG